MRRKKSKKLLSFGNVTFFLAVSSLVAMAILEQLRRPPEERTWQGSIFGIPYDFRLPTLERLRTTFWNKDSTQLLVPQAFGMGWTINFYPLLHPQSARS